MPITPLPQESQFAAIIAADYLDTFPDDSQAKMAADEHLDRISVYTIAWLDGFGRGRYGNRETVIGGDITSLALDVLTRVTERSDGEERPILCHRVGAAEDDDGELHERHNCPGCGAECDGDSPCRVIESI